MVPLRRAGRVTAASTRGVVVALVLAVAVTIGVVAPNSVDGHPPSARARRSPPEVSETKEQHGTVTVGTARPTPVASVDIAGVDVSDARSIEDAIASILRRKARLWNTSFSVAVRTSTRLVRVAAGTDDHRTNKTLTPTTLIPMGSVTKPFTAAGILRLVERGKLGLDERVAPRLDRALTAWNGTTLAKLFPGAADMVGRITVRQLLGMQVW